MLGGICTVSTYPLYGILEKDNIVFNAFQINICVFYLVQERIQFLDADAELPRKGYNPDYGSCDPERDLSHGNCALKPYRLQGEGCQKPK